MPELNGDQLSWCVNVSSLWLLLSPSQLRASVTKSWAQWSAQGTRSTLSRNNSKGPEQNRQVLGMKRPASRADDCDNDSPVRVQNTILTWMCPSFILPPLFCCNPSLERKQESWQGRRALECQQSHPLLIEWAACTHTHTHTPSLWLCQENLWDLTIFPHIPAASALHTEVSGSFACS